jgi:putative CocE/NonD family hydrolase
MFNVLEIDQSELSGLGKFEGPDPAFWCANGYAICNPDARGVYNSGGDSLFPGQQDGQDCHDLIEWLAARDWCTGKVGMSGNSYLAIAQCGGAAAALDRNCSLGRDERSLSRSRHARGNA